ncbi:oxoglutarate-dependent flavonoid 7-O-demethylase 1 [Vitis vinifera]|uniref:Fe2OG dioxygenase domain-containing protein n=1 Tax=Vitis vinifera TaxID=29760 RepID=F6HMF2_VITVI|nr:oxoglutarate-dependent flavonoid 7-O-demethylase 1 [Vitis vinifera]
MASTQSSSFRAAPIQSIQELIKEPIPAVPQPFILDDPQPPILSANTPLPLLPTIDMKHLIMSETAGSELEKLHSTCKEWGFFQLVNHGVNSSLVEKLKSEIGEFYKLPLEERMKYKMRPGDVEGYGHLPIRSEDQKLDWADRFYMITNPIHTRKPYLLPELPSSLRDSLECYLAELQKLAMMLLGFMAKALKLEKGEMEELFEDGMQSVRMSYYPPCPQPELVMGLTPHSDATGITILLQINGVDGLQIKKDGVWIPVSFLPDALVVNVGDVLEILSNGVYTSIEHRATVNAAKERISIAMFFNPKFSAQIKPAPSLINPQNPPLFKQVGMEKYFKDFFSRKLDGKLYLEHMKIKNEEDYST